MNAITAADQFPARDAMIPRFRVAGDVTLDLLHRDGRVEDRWLGLEPREFALLWHLAQVPGERLTRRQLFAQTREASDSADSGTVAVHIARVRAKLARLGLAKLVGTHPQGGYFLDLQEAPGPARGLPAGTVSTGPLWTPPGGSANPRGPAVPRGIRAA